MIRLSLGRIGSGKTLMEVYNMMKEENRDLTFYTNIRTDLPNQIDLTTDMIIKKEVVNVTKTGKETAKYHVNLEFWKDVKKPLAICIDETHAIADARRSSSAVNVAISNFLSVVRKIFSSTDHDTGEMIFISQRPNRVDRNIRDFANKVTYAVSQWVVNCECGYRAWDSSEAIDSLRNCPYCLGHLTKSDLFITVYHFESVDKWYAWNEGGMRTWYKVERVPHSEVKKVFGRYDSLQWENLINEI